MFNRFVIPEIEDALSYQAAVCIVGPRQVGKTTLALEVGESRNGIYLDMENPSDLVKLTNPDAYLNAFADRLVIIDEIHRVPTLFPVLRGIIDAGRRSGQGIGRFLLLGSASLDLVNKSGESLAGRISYINMSPLILSEVGNTQANLTQLWLRGGFPQSFLARTEKQSMAIRKDFIRTYLERDVPMFAERVPAESIGRLWTMLANNQGTLLNSSELGRSLSFSTQTTNRYIDLLVDLLLIRRLQPYVANVNKRLTKSPKVYIRDSGLVHALLQIDTFDKLLSHPVVGNSWEGFIIENLEAVMPSRTQLAFYRTGGGAEIDLVITLPDGKVWTVEIKRSMVPKLTKGYYEALKDIMPDKAFILTASADRYPFDGQSEVIGLAALMDELHQYA